MTNQPQKISIAFNDDEKEDAKSFIQPISEIALEPLQHKNQQKSIHYENIKCCKIKSQEKIDLFNLHQSVNCEIMTCTALVGPYMMKISFLNSEKKSPFHSMAPYSFGSYGQVYVYKNYQKQLKAVKCFALTKNQMKSQLKNIINEYCISRICSSAKIGPKINQNSFSMIIYETCIEFQTQFCEYNPTEQVETMNKSIQEAISVLHSLKIVHLDMKSEHISYSPHHQRWVFLDFGLSEVVKEDIGFKTWTDFKGNLKNASPQMIQIFKKKQPGFIDLYWNDLFGLRYVLSQNLRSNQNQHQQINYFLDQISEMDTKIKMEMLIVQLKYDLFFNQKTKLYSLYQQVIWPEASKQQIIIFLQEVFAYEANLHYFFLKHLKLLDSDILHQLENDRVSNFKKLNLKIGEFSMILQKNTPHKMNCQQIFIILETIGEDSKSDLMKLLQEEIYSIQSQQINLSNNKQNFGLPIKIRLTMKDIISSWSICQYYELLIEVVNFRKKIYPISFKEKASICRAYLEIHSQNIIQKQKDLYVIETTIKGIFKYCLSPPHTKWKRRMLNEVFCQCLILDILSVQQIIDFLRSIQVIVSYPAQAGIVFLQAFSDLDWYYCNISSRSRPLNSDLNRKLTQVSTSIFENNYKDNELPRQDISIYRQNMYASEIDDIFQTKILAFILKQIDPYSLHFKKYGLMREGENLYKLNNNIIINSFYLAIEESLKIINKEILFAIIQKIEFIVDCPEITNRFVFAFWKQMYKKNEFYADNQELMVRIIQDNCLMKQSQEKNPFWLKYLLKIWNNHHIFHTHTRPNPMETLQKLDKVNNDSFQTFDVIIFLDILFSSYKCSANESSLAISRFIKEQIDKFTNEQLIDLENIAGINVCIIYNFLISTNLKKEEDLSALINLYEKHLVEQFVPLPQGNVRLLTYKVSICRLMSLTRTLSEIEEITQLYLKTQCGNNYLKTINDLYMAQFQTLKDPILIRELVMNYIYKINRLECNFIVFATTKKFLCVFTVIQYYLIMDQKYEECAQNFRILSQELYYKYKRTYSYVFLAYTPIFFSLFQRERTSQRWEKVSRYLLSFKENERENPYMAIIYLRLVVVYQHLSISQNTENIIKLFRMISARLVYIEPFFRQEIIWNYYYLFLKQYREYVRANTRKYFYLMNSSFQYMRSTLIDETIINKLFDEILVRVWIYKGEFSPLKFIKLFTLKLFNKFGIHSKKLFKIIKKANDIRQFDRSLIKI